MLQHLTVVYCFLIASGLCSVAAGVTLFGSEYQRLRDISRNLNMRYVELQNGKRVFLKDRRNQLEFSLHKRGCQLNGLTLFLGNPIVSHRGVFYISQRDVEKTLSPILTPYAFPAPQHRLIRILIDPGHGGKDPGAQNKDLDIAEKYLSLEVAKKLREKLKAYGYDIHLTRDRDKTLSLNARGQHANRIKADLFISIHFNATVSSAVHGIECYTFTPQYHPSSNRTKLHASDKRYYAANHSDHRNQLLGFVLQKTLVEATNAYDRGLKRARWTVLRDLQCPGVLVELGFVTHPIEGSRIRTPAYRNQLVEALARGIRHYDGIQRFYQSASK